jgi:hypothetical protein
VALPAIAMATQTKPAVVLDFMTYLLLKDLNYRDNLRLVVRTSGHHAPRYKRISSGELVSRCTSLKADGTDQLSSGFSKCCFALS